MFCCKKRKPPFIPSALERLREFFIFCDGLENHPFFTNYQLGGPISIKSHLPGTGDDAAELSFDEFHLESLLTRLRQFLFRNELFYVKDLRKAMVKIIEEDDNFRTFYDKLLRENKKPFPQSNIQVLKENGADMVAGFNLPQLIEARLYTGAIHSVKRIDPNAGAHLSGVASDHILVSKQLTFVLAGASLKCVQNIFSFRNHILRLARIKNKTEIFPELKNYAQRSKNA